jgi:hypothetical protein
MSGHPALALPGLDELLPWPLRPLAPPVLAADDEAVDDEEDDDLDDEEDDDLDDDEFDDEDDAGDEE